MTVYLEAETCSEKENKEIKLLLLTAPPKQVTVIEDYIYVRDLAPSDFFLFPRMKRSLIGKRFCDVDKVKGNTLTALNSIQPQEFQHCFEHWKNRWDKCIKIL
jgi:hypothetical protein